MAAEFELVPRNATVTRHFFTKLPNATLMGPHRLCDILYFSEIDKESIHFDNQSTTERFFGPSTIEREKALKNQNISKPFSGR